MIESIADGPKAAKSFSESDKSKDSSKLQAATKATWAPGSEHQISSQPPDIMAATAGALNAAKVDGTGITFQGGKDASQKAPAPSRSVFGEIAHEAMLFGEGVISGSVGNAINGVKQLYDHATGEKYTPTELFSNQKEVDASRAGKIGETLGMGVDFVGVTVATGGIADAVGLAGAGAFVASAGVAGVVEGGILTPSSEDSFIAGRLENAAIGGVSGAASVGAGLGINALAGGIKSAVASTAVRLGGNMVAGGGTGALAAEATSLATTGHLATGDQFALAVATGAAGGALSVVGARGSTAKSPTADVTAPVSTQKPVPNIDSGKSTAPAAGVQRGSSPQIEERKGPEKITGSPPVAHLTPEPIAKPSKDADLRIPHPSEPKIATPDSPTISPIDKLPAKAEKATPEAPARAEGESAEKPRVVEFEGAEEALVRSLKEGTPLEIHIDKDQAPALMEMLKRHSDFFMLKKPDLKPGDKGYQTFDAVTLQDLLSKTRPGEAPGPTAIKAARLASDQAQMTLSNVTKELPDGTRISVSGNLSHGTFFDGRTFRSADPNADHVWVDSRKIPNGSKLVEGEVSGGQNFSALDDTVPIRFKNAKDPEGHPVLDTYVMKRQGGNGPSRAFLDAFRPAAEAPGKWEPIGVSMEHVVIPKGIKIYTTHKAGDAPSMADGDRGDTFRADGWGNDQGSMKKNWGAYSGDEKAYEFIKRLYKGDPEGQWQNQLERLEHDRSAAV